MTQTIESARRLRRAALAVCLAAASGAASNARAQVTQSSGDYGEIGLMQTPTARFADPGDFRLSWSEFHPYENWSLSATPYSWMEATFRYTLLKDDPLGTQGDPGNLLDKSFGLRFKLLKETDTLPAVSLGMLDIAGTSLFSSEYFAANKQVGDFDVSFGLAWGRFGNRGDFSNPLTSISSRFSKERTGTSAGGELAVDNLFTGDRMGWFGGVRWRPGNAPYSLMIEYDGNDYKNEPYGPEYDPNKPGDIYLNDIGARWPINFGGTYRWHHIDMALAYERGKQLTARITLDTNLARSDSGPPKIFDPPPTPVVAANVSTQGRAEYLDRLVQKMGPALQRQGLHLVAVDGDPGTGILKIWFDNSAFQNEARAAGRVARAAAMFAPSEFKTFEITLVRGGFDQYRVTLDRQAELDNATANEGRGAAAPPQGLTVTPVSGENLPDDRGARYDDLYHPRAFDWSISPKLRQNLGDPDQLFHGQIWIAGDASYQINPFWNVAGEVGLNVYNDFDSLDRDPQSLLPHVRSDFAKYLNEGDSGLYMAETNYIRRLAPGLYGRVSAGIFEQMFGGVAGEVLYQQPGSSWGVGLDVNHLRQRGYGADFSFLDYEVTTGYASVYYHFKPMNMFVKVSAGRYLAKDKGATVELSRRFNTGAEVGVFMTKTNVSAGDFGEGSYDKGFFVKLPLDLFFPKSTRSSASFLFRPLTRDGGQMARDGTPIYDLITSDTDDFFAADSKWGR